MKKKLLKTNLVLATALLMIGLTTGLAEIQGTISTVDKPDLTEELPIQETASTDTAIIINATTQSLAAPVNEADAILTSKKTGEETEIDAKKIQQNCPGRDDQGNLEFGCRYVAIINVDEYEGGTYEYIGRVDYRSIQGWQETNKREILIDHKPPQLSQKTPNKKLNPEDPEKIQAEFTDLTTEVTNTSLKITQAEETIAQKSPNKNKAQIELKSDQIQSRTKYTVRYKAKDKLDNTLTGKWNIYTEQEYNGDKNPEYPEDKAIKWSKNNEGEPKKETKLNVTYSESQEKHEKFPIKLSCYNNNQLISETQQKPEEASKINTFNLSCQIPDEYLGEEANITFETCDIAGNCIQNVTKEYVFDGDKPNIDSISVPANRFKGDFLLGVDAKDETTKVEKIRYRYGELEPNYGQYKNGEVLIKSPDTYPGSSGEYRLTVKAVDSSGQLSDGVNTDINFIGRDGTVGIEEASNHEINLQTSEKTQKIPSGEKKNISVLITNEENIYLSQSKIKVGSVVANKSKQVYYMKPGETRKINFEIKSSDYGKHKAFFEMENIRVEDNIIIIPNRTQQVKINSLHEENTENIQELKKRVKKAKETAMKSKKINDLENKLRELKEINQDTSKALEESKYYIASENFQDFEDKSAELERTYKDYMNQYRQNRWLGTILLFLGGIAGLIVLLEAFFQTNEDYDISFTDIEYLKIIKNSLKKLKTGIKPKLKAFKQTSNKIIQKVLEKLKIISGKIMPKLETVFKDKEFEEYEKN